MESEVSAKTAIATEPLGIEAGRVYPLNEFMALTRLGRHAMRHARRNGLKVGRVGNRAFINGSDFIAYLGGAKGRWQ